jgi:hypothetical protein
MKRFTTLQTIGLTAVALGLLAFAMPIQAGDWRAVTADHDYFGECASALPALASAALPGGISCFGKMAQQIPAGPPPQRAAHQLVDDRRCP